MRIPPSSPAEACRFNSSSFRSVRGRGCFRHISFVLGSFVTWGRLGGKWTLPRRKEIGEGSRNSKKHHLKAGKSFHGNKCFHGVVEPLLRYFDVQRFVKGKWLPCRFRGLYSCWLALVSVSLCGLLAGRWGFGTGTEKHSCDALKNGAAVLCVSYPASVSLYFSHCDLLRTLITFKLE